MLNRIKNYLDIEDVSYNIINHRPTFTAQETAEITETPTRNFAKTVIVRSHDKMIMFVLPACCKLNFKLLRKVVRRGDIRLAQESEFEYLFPDCETGAMPPLGNIYGLDVFVDETLTHDDNIVFNSGSHEELIELLYRDFARIVRPHVCHVSELEL